MSPRLVVSELMTALRQDCSLCMAAASPLKYQLMVPYMVYTPLRLFACFPVPLFPCLFTGFRGSRCSLPWWSAFLALTAHTLFLNMMLVVMAAGSLMLLKGCPCT
jgi:hypothetical protein